MLYLAKLFVGLVATVALETLTGSDKWTDWFWKEFNARRVEVSQ